MTGAPAASGNEGLPASVAANRGALVGVALGVAGLVLKPWYRGPGADAVHSWLGNVSASFAVYFVATIAGRRLGRGRVFAAAAALATVEAFEVFDGFGFMSNTYDPWDLAANAVGIALAFLADAAAGLTARRGRVR